MTKCPVLPATDRSYGLDLLRPVPRRNLPYRTLSAKSKEYRRGRRYGKMVERRGLDWTVDWMFLTPVAVKPSKRGRHG